PRTRPAGSRANRGGTTHTRISWSIRMKRGNGPVDGAALKGSSTERAYHLPSRSETGRPIADTLRSPTRPLVLDLPIRRPPSRGQSGFRRTVHALRKTLYE